MASVAGGIALCFELDVQAAGDKLADAEKLQACGVLLTRLGGWRWRSTPSSAAQLTGVHTVADLDGRL